MYYSNLTNEEVRAFHGIKIKNFTISLTEILTSPLFYVENVTGGVNRIYPLFYTDSITSSNNKDRIIENKVILSIKQEVETYYTFISDKNAEIVDYDENGIFYKFSDELNEEQYNAFVSLLRRFHKHNEQITIKEKYTGTYGEYLFDIDDTTVVDTGIIITDETIRSKPCVKLSNPFFKNSQYLLKLNILHYTGANIKDYSEENYKIVETLQIELKPDEWVDIPISRQQKDYIIQFEAIVDINHNQAVIQGFPTQLMLTSNRDTAQVGDVVDLTATARDDFNPVPNIPVYFFEMKNNGTLKLETDKTILSWQDKDTCTLTATLDANIKDNQRITFKAGNYILDVVSTNQNGVATCTYESLGVGDITLTAECNGLTATCKIEDCYKYWSDTEIDHTNEMIVDIGLPQQFEIDFGLYSIDPTQPTSISTLKFNNVTGAWMGKGESTSAEVTWNHQTLHTILKNTHYKYAFKYKDGIGVLSSGNDSVSSTVPISKLYSIASKGNTYMEYVKIKIQNWE